MEDAFIRYEALCYIQEKKPSKDGWLKFNRVYRKSFDRLKSHKDPKE
jgi:hypothetical protein